MEATWTTYGTVGPRWRHHEFPIEGRDWIHDGSMGPRNHRLAGCAARTATVYYRGHPAVNIGNQGSKVGFVSIANIGKTILY